MFKLESYLTPLILNYVGKYIKNLKPEDSQYSLWGGDAVFSNLDLKLDVLEEELQLPFTFVNGHIHELRIHVPWTKLGSEPVIITINTIECILKLCCSDESGPDCDSQKIIRSRKRRSSITEKNTEAVEAPPGYVQSLINRVISNICIVCNNLILKYVEDDIVLSLNIKSVELLNVNDKWDKAFVDSNATDSIIRKVIYMQDLTVCLDKRDASGKIETYQDPLLYRCSTTWRLYSFYNSPLSKYPLATRIHMYCENLEFSLTDQQLPMFLRLLSLCVALHNRSTFKDKEDLDEIDDEFSDMQGHTKEENSDFYVSKNQDEGWGAWAWSFVPELPGLYAANSEEQEQENNMLLAEKILQFGIFIGKASCTFKQTVIAQDNVFCGTSKCSFNPLLVLQLFGCSVEVTCRGKDFANIQAGVTGATVTGLEDCVCGYPDFSTMEDETDHLQRKRFLKSGVPPFSGHVYSYLTSSLFDPLAPENCGLLRKYCFNPEEHFSNLTEEVMVQRFPAFAFDYLYELRIPEDWQDRVSLITNSFLEESNWHESSVCRLIFGPLCVDLTSSFVHRLSMFVSSVQEYEYPSYSHSRKVSSQVDALDENVIEELKEFVPTRQYHVTFFKPVIHLFAADHSNSMKNDPKKAKKKKSKISKFVKTKEPQIFLEIYAECIDLQSSIPMYPSRLVSICNSHPSQTLVHHCYCTNSVKLFGLEVSLQEASEKVKYDTDIIHHASFTCFLKYLILPEVWKNDDLVLKEYSFECGNISLQLGEINFMSLICIYQSWMAKYMNPSRLQVLKTDVLACQAGPQRILCNIFDVKCSLLRAANLTCYKASVSSLSVKLKNEEKLSVLFQAPEITQNMHNNIYFKDNLNTFDKEDWRVQNFLLLVFQIPGIDSELPPLFVVRISGATFCLEPALLHWFSSITFPDLNCSASRDSESFYPASIDIDNTSTCSTMTPDASMSQTFTKSLSSTFLSPSNNQFQEKLENTIFQHSTLLSKLVLDVEICSWCGLLSQLPWSISHIEGLSSLESWKHAALNGGLDKALVIISPICKVKNNSSISIILEDPFQCALPIKNCIEEKRAQDCFPWNLQVNCFSIYTLNNEEDGLSFYYVLHPTSISATIALSLKDNENQMGLCIHMDSKYMGISLSAFETLLIVDCFKSCASFSKFVEKLRIWITHFQSKFPDVSGSTSAAPDALLQENAYDMPIKDEISNKIDENGSLKNNSKNLTLWSQFTLSKLKVVLFGKLLASSEHENFKVQFEAEEIISSLDIQDVYSKIKVKLTSLNGKCFTRRYRKEEWSPGPYDGILLVCNDLMPKAKSTALANNAGIGTQLYAKSSNQPFLLATYTKALCTSAKEKWMIMQNCKEKLESNEFISEIDIKVKSFDLLLWMSLFDTVYQTFSPFLKMYQSSYSPYDSFTECKYPIGISFCNQNLPLLYIETSIIQIYLPENSVLTSSFMIQNNEDTNVSVTEISSDVLLLQLDYVTLTSQVENPLTRIILDSEAYNDALKSKSLSLPGAAIEDRQYQMDLNGLSLGSVSGVNILPLKHSKKNLVLSYPLTMGENPALEWNIGVIPENRNISDDLVATIPIMSPLNIRVAVAPAIVCMQSHKNISEKKVIAGISMEVSVNTDISLYFCVNQLCFIYSVLNKNLNFLSNILSTNPVSDALEQGKVVAEKEDQEFPFIIPPCFTHASASPCVQILKDESVENRDFIPFEVLVTAGTVSMMFYYYENNCDLGNKNVSSASSLRNIHEEQLLKSTKSFQGKCGSIATVGLKNLVQDQKVAQRPKLLHPFLCICITEPHSYIMCCPSEQKFESSCFDFQLRGSAPDFIVEKSHEFCMPVIDDFVIPYLETKPGEPKAKTGIPPSFFTVSCTDFFHLPANINICLERPVKLTIQSEICDSILKFIQSFQHEFAGVNLKSDRGTESCFQGNDALVSAAKLNLIKFLKNIRLQSTQVMLELRTQPQDDYSDKLFLTFGTLKIESEVKTHKDDLKGFDLNANLTEFTVQMNIDNQSWSFVKPTTFSFYLQNHLNPWFQTELRFVGESLLFNLSFHYLSKLKDLIASIQKQFESQIENFKKVVGDSEGLESTNAELYIKRKKRQHWNDDLRKGLFQFIQACDDHFPQPKAQEIIFNRASSSQPASMTWCYPEPRALTKIEVSPVPFQCEEGKCLKDKQVLTCYLQYWNPAQQEYLNLCDFKLSETEHSCLELPDLNADSLPVSDKWRVLLDCRSYIDDDGILERENPCLSPLALAACMSIDSCFDPSLIPVIQVQASFEMFKIYFYNFFDKTGYTPLLHPFEFDDASPQNQEFALLSLINPTFSCSKWSSKLKSSISSGVTCEVLEFKNLTMLPAISPVDIHCNMSVHYGNEQGFVYDVDMVLHPCFFRITQSIIHTLNFSIYSISKEYVDLNSSAKYSECILPNYFLICNNIHESVRFGQVDTEEYIILSPLKIHAYSWWCHKKKQMLRISCSSSQWKWSHPFSVDIPGQQAVPVNDELTIIIKVKELSNLQKQVTIDGQLSVYSQLSFPLQLKCDFSNSLPTRSEDSSSFLIKSISPKSCSPFFLLSPDQCRNFKLFVTGIIDSQLWSEDICFDDSKLIQVPYENSSQSVWCHVKHQKQNSSFFITIFICPLLIIQNNFPIPLTIEFVLKNNQSHEIELGSQGEERNTFEGLDSVEEFLMGFKNAKILKADVTNTECNFFQNPPEPFCNEENPEKIYNAMQLHQEEIWPYSSFGRKILADTKQHLFPCNDWNKDYKSAVPVCGRELFLKIDRSQRWNGINTLLVDIKPYCMVINNLQSELYLFTEKELQWILPPDSVAVPSQIHESFYFAIKVEDKFFKSCVLNVVEFPSATFTADAASDFFSYQMNTPLSLPHSGAVNIFMMMEERSCQVIILKLKCAIHDGIVIIDILPVISVFNQSQTNLKFSLSLFPDKTEKVVFGENSDYPILTCFMGCRESLLLWNLFTNFEPCDQQDCDFYIQISIENSDEQLWSYPLHLHSLLAENNRHFVSLPIKSSSTYSTVPMVISSHKWNGMLYLVINNDTCPVLFLHNQTNMDIFYGQNIPVTGGKSVYEEMLKHEIIPLVKPDCSVHYTFPSIQDKFPAIIDKIPMLCLGSIEQNGKYVWSKPFGISVNKQFVHILGICDFVINCKRIGHTTNIYIDIANRVEVTAREVRSRIVMATDFERCSDETRDPDVPKSKLHLSKKDKEKSIKHKMPYPKLAKRISYLDLKVPFILYMNIRVVHASLIFCDELKESHKSIEVCRLNVDNALFFSRPKSERSCFEYQEVFLCFERIQLDNQMDSDSNTIYDFPVILNRPVLTVQSSETHETDTFLPNKVKENSVFLLNAIIELPYSACNALVIQTLNISLLPISICIEDTFYYSILKLFKSYAPLQLHKHYTLPCGFYFPRDVMYVSSIFAAPVCFQELKINIPEVTFSVHASLKLYLSLENSVLKFQPFEQENVFSTSHEIGRAIVLHYLTGALFKAGWVVGSLDLLGNPSGFARAVGAGMSDFVYLPYKGFFCGPRAFISGLSSGAMSLFTQISSGAIISMAKMASSISRNMDYLSLDDEHLTRQEYLRHHMPKGIAEGFIQGLSGLGLSALSAVAGIADHPLQALVHPSTPLETASGIVSGFGKGIVGVFTKPIGGAAELLSQTGYGLLHGAGWLTPSKRQYQPINMTYDMTSSSCLKYACKIIQCDSLGDIMVSLEATYVNENGEYEKNILLLTSEALCILADDEITLQRSFALSEIRCNKAESDQSTLVIIPSEMYKKEIFMESGGSVERVIEFITKTREENYYTPQDDLSEFLSKSTASCHIFYLFPKDRSLFLALFSYAKSKAMGKGFFC